MVGKGGKPSVYVAIISSGRGGSCGGTVSPVVPLIEPRHVGNVEQLPVRQKYRSSKSCHHMTTWRYEGIGSLQYYEIILLIQGTRQTQIHRSGMLESSRFCTEICDDVFAIYYNSLSRSNNSACHILW